MAACYVPSMGRGARTLVPGTKAQRAPLHGTIALHPLMPRHQNGSG